jgi:hypothetical protein
MTFLHVGIAEIYQTIHILNIPQTAKACFGGHICNCVMILAFYYRLPSSTSQDH